MLRRDHPAPQLVARLSAVASAVHMRVSGELIPVLAGNLTWCKPDTKQSSASLLFLGEPLKSRSPLLPTHISFAWSRAWRPALLAAGLGKHLLSC